MFYTEGRMSKIEIPPFNSNVITDSFGDTIKIFEAAERRMENPVPSEHREIQTAVREMRDMFVRVFTREEIAEAAAGAFMMLWHLKTHGVPVKDLMPT